MTLSAIGVIVGGLIGTLVMTAMMQIGAKMGMMPPDFNMMIDGMGAKMNKIMGLPNQMAMVMHFFIGTLILPLLYLWVWIPLGIIGGIIGAIIFFLIFGAIMIIMLPMLGAPEEWRGKMAMGIIMGHILYAIIVFLIGNAI